MKKTSLILSCEHASNQIPQHFEALIAKQSNADNPFAHFDPFAKELTIALATHMDCPYVLGNISRMAIDLNKNIAHEHCFKEKLRESLSETDKNILLKDYFYPYRQQLEAHIYQLIGQNQQVLHVSVHSFCPKERGVEHNAAIGLLYDSHRSGEKEVVRIWHELLLKRTPYTVRLNYPRSGRGDNYTSYLRKQLNQEDYLGIELEVNALVLEDNNSVDNVHEDLKISLFSLLEMI
jgi:predicted N-formylglutamate amidohydrolase